MTTTGRSESTKAYFDGHVHSNTMLNEFVVQYEKVVRALRGAKKKDDFQNMNTQAILSRLTMLRKIVTHGTYSGSSQAEFIASNNCTHEMLNKMSTYWIELVEEDR